MMYTPKEAVEYIKEMYSFSNSIIALLLSDKQLTVQPIQITNYLRGRGMRADVRLRFFIAFDLVIIENKKTTYDYKSN